MNTIEIITKYPEIAEAAQKQGIQLSKVFAKCEDIDGDGNMDSFGYPMVRLDQEGNIPVDGEQILFDPMRLKAANMLSKLHGEDVLVQEKVAEAMKSVTNVQEDVGGDPNEVDGQDVAPTDQHDMSTFVGI